MGVPRAKLRDSRGRIHRLRPGDLIGRAVSATCRLHDPRVSEAHALICLRGGALCMLALRQPLWLEGIAEEGITLEAGQRIALVDGVVLDVIDVEPAQEILAVQVDGERIVALFSPVYSLVVGPQHEWIPDHLPEAVAWIWSTAEGWMLHVSGARPDAIRPGRQWLVGLATIRAITLSTDQLSSSATQDRRVPLRLVARHTTVHVHRHRHRTFAIDGVQGRMLSELATVGCPATWQSMSEAVWPEEEDVLVRRRRWDRVRQRLTVTLRDHGVRTDLVRTDGHGNFEVFLLPGDEIVDET